MFGKMKELVVSVLVVCGILVVAGGVGTFETHYDKQMFVWSVDGKEVVLEDKMGEQWVWETTEQTFEEGDRVKVRMFTNYTDNTIYDDEIVKVKRLDK